MRFFRNFFCTQFIELRMDPEVPPSLVDKVNVVAENPLTRFVLKDYPLSVFGQEFINSWVLILQTEIGMYPKASAIHDSMDHDEIEPEPKICNLDGVSLKMVRNEKLSLMAAAVSPFPKWEKFVFKKQKKPLIRWLKFDFKIRSCPTKNNQRKVPKRVHKAVREKLKREHLHDLFLELANALDLTHQNTGKAFILCEAIRLVKDTIAQIDCLKKENAALFSESHYVNIEKNELRDENSVLEDQIDKLQTEIKERAALYKPDLNSAPSEFQQTEVTQHCPGSSLRFPSADQALQQSSVVGPVLVVPFASGLRAYPGQALPGQSQS
ncbi:Transcription factor bHLH47 [Vitis vinifera]|uniref:Transcription factor bHLH47 n=1 Tax=Vitis vinifera TaxID=29760 RepID=A0A438BUJ2_VITVI|nr:Transcription factor bHLH47 [Vitis vinifera]